MLQIRSRSGLAFNRGVVAFHGTVDSDYTGEIKVLLFNFGREPVEIHAGDRIAQGALVRCEDIYFDAVDELPHSVRASNGFGSSGA